MALPLHIIAVMRFSGAFIIAALLATPLMATESSAVELEVVLSEKRLHVVQNGARIKTYRVAIGTIDHPTPEGTYAIKELIWNPGWIPLPDREWTKNATKKEPSDRDNPMRVLKLPFDAPYYFIHGTPDASSIGKLASHGCVRMNERDVEELGRIIMRLTATPLDEAWLEQLRTDGKTGTVKLSAPIELKITMGRRNVYPGVVWAVE